MLEKAVQTWPCATIPTVHEAPAALGKATQDWRLEAVHLDQCMFFFWSQDGLGNELCGESSC